MSKTYGFLLEFIPMKIGAGMTFLEVTLNNHNTKNRDIEKIKASLGQEGLL